MAITVLEGDFGDFANIVPAPGGIKYWAREPGQILPRREFAAVEKLEFLGANETGGSSFDPLMGAIGAEAIGPAGMLLGTKRRRIKRTIYFTCKLKDGRYFKGATLPDEYDKLRLFVFNKYAESIYAVVYTIAILTVLSIVIWLISLM